MKTKENTWMDIMNCKRCGRVFQYKGKLICDICVTQDDEDYKIIRDYIHNHSNATPIEISEHTQVELKTITRFLREGRLEAEGIDAADSGLQCEKCGRVASDLTKHSLNGHHQPPFVWMCRSPCHDNVHGIVPGIRKKKHMPSMKQLMKAQQKLIAQQARC
jgi:ribosomal protein L37E